MLYYLEELKKLNVEFLESTEKTPKGLKKDYLKCIFNEKAKEAIKKQTPEREYTYFLTSRTNKKFIDQVILSNSEYHVVFQSEGDMLFLFDKNFDNLLSVPFGYEPKNDFPIYGPYWNLHCDSNLSITFLTDFNEAFSMKPHKNKKGQFLCSSTLEEDKVSFFVFEEDNIKVNFHNSVIKNMFFNNNGNLTHLNLLERISSKTIKNIHSYNDFKEAIQEEIDIHSLCTDKLIKIMNEDAFHKQLKFIKEIIITQKEFNTEETYLTINNIKKYFSELNIFINSKDIKNELANSAYSGYYHMQKNKDSKRNSLLFIAMMKKRNYTINTFLEKSLMKDIYHVNKSVNLFVNHSKPITNKTIKNKNEPI